MKIRTEALQFKADQKLISFIEKRLLKVGQLVDQIIDAQVTLKLENSGKVRDKITEVKLTLPGKTLIASDSQKTFEASATKAVDTLKRQLIKYKERRNNN